MNYNILYNINNNILEYIEPELLLDKIYLLEYKVPNQDELKKINKNKTNNTILKLINKDLINDFIDNIKEYISRLEYKMPLYDIYTSNIYLIYKENIYQRVYYNHYRFPDIIVINELKLEFDKLKNKNITDQLELRKKRKYDLMINFMDNFNLKTLEDTYYRMIYKYSEHLGKNIIFCKRPSFNKYIHNTKPYYTSIEIINLARNMNIKFNLKEKDFDINKLCIQVRENDINYKIISSHQKYINEQDLLGLIQYYTVQGSFFVNSYLRNLVDYNFNNIFLDNIILPLWNLCLDAPAFDKDYILYRFIKDDKHLKHLKIGDIFQDEGFLSTTRDPFYKSDIYDFGFILMKIKIPKNTKGVGLCVEMVSHFPTEQEILFAPKTKFKLISRDNDIKYYHTDLDFSSNVKTKYEFEWVSNVQPIIEKKKSNVVIPYVDFINIKNGDNDDLESITSYFTNKYTDNLSRFIVKIGDIEFLTIVEKFNSVGAYKDFYAIETNTGVSIYSIYKNYLAFFIELGYVKEQLQMHVNYYVKYNTLNKENIFTSYDFVKFISSVAYYYNIDKVFIYPEYKPCSIVTNIIQREFNNKIKENLKNIEDLKSIEKEIDIKQFSGNFCYDYYNYLKFNKKRFFVENIKSIELSPLFNYYDLDYLKTIDIDKILEKTDDELYQLYIKEYKLEYPKSKLVDYFIWIIENKCYLIESLINKLNKLYKNFNPFKNDVYILNPKVFLYNNGFIKIYGSISIDYDFKERKQYKIPENEYRLIKRNEFN
jgi:hypothetical protein